MTLCLLQTPRDPGDPCSNQGRLNSGISKIEVSRICADLDSEVAAFRDRSLAGQSFPYVFLDATYCKARVSRRVISQAVVVATGVCGDAAARSSASRWATPRMAPSGPPSSARSRPEASPGAAGHHRRPPGAAPCRPSGAGRRGHATLPRAVSAQRVGPGPQGLGRDRHPDRVSGSGGGTGGRRRRRRESAASRQPGGTAASPSAPAGRRHRRGSACRPAPPRQSQGRQA